MGLYIAQPGGRASPATPQRPSIQRRSRRLDCYKQKTKATKMEAEVGYVNQLTVILNYRYSICFAQFVNLF